MKRYLVFCRVDDHSLHKEWLAPADQRNFDVYLEYFGDQENWYCEDGEYYSQYKTGRNKFQRFQALFREQNDLFLKYEAIWFVDDDISVNAQTVNRMFELFTENQLWLAQPALSHDSYFSHQITLHDPKYCYRFTNFVEVMAPLFSSSALQQCLETFSENHSTWGIDFVWSKMLGEPKDKIAILDETQVKHTRPVGQGPLYQGMNKTPLDEMKAVMEKYGVDFSYEFKTYGGKRRIRIASISMVKNESDIIESFVRYHLLLLDHMIILDSGSTDATYEILQKLCSEGCSLTVLKEDMTAFNQPEIMSRLLKQAAHAGRYDLVIPLDADEFLAKDGYGELRSYLEQLQLDQVYDVQWRTYLPHSSDNPAEKFIPTRMQYARLDKYETFYKVLVPKKLVLECDLALELGNHDVTSDKVKHEVLGELRIAHYPIRSMQQLKSKAVIGWISHLSRHDRKDNENWHWEKVYEAFLKRCIQSQEDLVKLAKEYSSQSLKKQGYIEEVQVRRIPLQIPYGKDPIRIIYTDENTLNAEGNILRFAEKLAREYSDLKKTNFQTTSAIRTDIYYQIMNLRSKKVLEVDSERMGEGAAVLQGRDTKRTHQQWRFEPVGEGCYFIINRNSGLLLDVNSSKPGTPLVQRPKNSGYNQQWYVVARKQNCYCIVNRHSLQCLDIVKSTNQIIQNYANKHTDQQWYIASIE